MVANLQKTSGPPKGGPLGCSIRCSVAVRETLLPLSVDLEDTPEAGPATLSPAFGVAEERHREAEEASEPCVSFIFAISARTSARVILP